MSELNQADLRNMLRHRQLWILLGTSTSYMVVEQDLNCPKQNCFIVIFTE